jgi:hypothetical protein
MKKSPTIIPCPKKSKVIIEVDTALVFSILSVLEVRMEKLPSKSKVFQSLEKNAIKIEESLKRQLGIKLFANIIFSDDYFNLYDANQEVLNTIDNIKDGLIIDGKDLNLLNDKKDKARDSLQKKFFGLPKKTKKRYNKK